MTTKTDISAIEFQSETSKHSPDTGRGVKPDKSFTFLGTKVSYIHASAEIGWGHDEGEVIARDLVSMSQIFEKTPVGYTGKPRAIGLRIIFGSHSLWFVR